MGGGRTVNHVCYAPDPRVRQLPLVPLRVLAPFSNQYCKVVSHGKEIRELTPAVIMKLKQLHETFLLEASANPQAKGFAVAREDTFAAGAVGSPLSPGSPPLSPLGDDNHASDDGWEGDSWHVSGRPPRGMERPMEIRSLQLLPRALARKKDHEDAAAEAAPAAEEWLSLYAIAAVNSKGQKSSSSHRGSLGQDALSVSRLASGWTVLCVMDGHGPQGHWPALRACRSVPWIMRSGRSMLMFKQRGAPAALVDLFEQVQADLEAAAPSEGVDLRTSGCTAVCVFWSVKHETIWTATAGDSRAVLFSLDRGLLAETKDHKGSTEAERRRIEGSGGEVYEQRRGDGRAEARVRIQGQEFPNIAMSRSLGDLCMKDIGLIAEPEVVGWPYVADGLVLAASDGVWEHMSSAEAVALVVQVFRQGGSHQNACDELLEAARGRWRRYVSGSYCDDITIVLASMHATTTVRSGTTSKRPRRKKLYRPVHPGGVNCESSGCQVM